MNGVPQYVHSMLQRLRENGYEAFLVGGCVRDMLMGKRPHDWDMASSALPEQVMALFPRVIPTGIRHGTVSVLWRKARVELTTFRSDGNYLDGRRPAQVSFLAGLEEDLNRRDFTINAMAMGEDGNLVDLFGGRADLQRKLIRCVGVPERRFEEDALRMLRAVRFSAQLEFTIEKETSAAIERCANRAAALSAERVRDEVEKILRSSRPELLERAATYGLLSAYLSVPPGGLHGLTRLKRLPKYAAERWAGLCAILEGQRAISDTECFLRALKLDGATIRGCVGGMILAAGMKRMDRTQWKRLLSQNPYHCVLCAAAAADTMGADGHLCQLRAVLKSGECFSLGKLAVNGKMLEELGYPRGESIGKELKRLLAHVVEHPEQNKREILLEKAAEDRPFCI